jgi:hypothetical protein
MLIPFGARHRCFYLHDFMLNFALNKYLMFLFLNEEAEAKTKKKY